MYNIKKLERLYFATNTPFPYELKCGHKLIMKPILVKDWDFFEDAIDVLKINKNEIPDINVVQMTYLEFLNEIIKKDKILAHSINYILKYSVGISRFKIEKEDKKKMSIFLGYEEDDTWYEMKSKEFDEFKDIILYQNIPNYKDQYIIPEIRKAIEAHNKLKMKNQVSPTLEKQKVFVTYKTGISDEKLDNMTYRKFKQLYDMAYKDDVYRTNLEYKMSPNYKQDNNGLTHPLFEKDADILDEWKTDIDSFKKQINGVN